MYHYPILFTVIFSLDKFDVPEGHRYNLILYTITIGITLLVASASYRWFETPFLAFKNRFAIIQSKR
jgi:peptidoglycan/LPS O-acetylase OafA/YrhL